MEREQGQVKARGRLQWFSTWRHIKKTTQVSVLPQAVVVIVAWFWACVFFVSRRHLIAQ